MTYKFVTREEIDKKGTYANLWPIVNRLLSERDVIRKVGLTHFKWRFDRDPELQNKWNGETTTKEDFDAEVARIMESSNYPDNRQEMTNRERATKLFSATAEEIEHALDEKDAEWTAVADKALRLGKEYMRKKAANIADRFTKDPYTSDTATECENVRNLILALPIEGE